MEPTTPYGILLRQLRSRFDGGACRSSPSNRNNPSSPRRLRMCRRSNLPIRRSSRTNNPINQPQQPSYPQAGYGVPQGGAPIQERNIALCILLTIVTCGIYGIYWMICMVNDLNTAADCPGDTSGGIVLFAGSGHLQYLHPVLAV